MPHKEFWENKDKYVLVKLKSGGYVINTKDGMAILLDENDELAEAVMQRMLKEGVQVARYKGGKLVDDKTEDPIVKGG